MLAKEIAEKVIEVARGNNLNKISEVVIKLGTISLAHDGMDAHPEDIDSDNLRFALEEILKLDGFVDINFVINRVPGEDWELVSLN